MATCFQLRITNSLPTPHESAEWAEHCQCCSLRARTLLRQVHDPTHDGIHLPNSWQAYTSCPPVYHRDAASQHKGRSRLALHTKREQVHAGATLYHASPRSKKLVRSREEAEVREEGMDGLRR
jgi:hypothetical protein